MHASLLRSVRGWSGGTVGLVVLAGRVAQLLAVLKPGAAELAEGDRISAGFGQEVTAPAESVSVAAEPVAGHALAAKDHSSADRPSRRAAVRARIGGGFAARSYRV